MQQLRDRVDEWLQLNPNERALLSIAQKQATNNDIEHAPGFREALRPLTQMWGRKACSTIVTGHLGQLPNSPLTWLSLGLLLLLVAQSVRLWWSQNRAARRVARHRRLGERGERRAEQLLARAGYRILEQQVSGQYQVAVNGRLVGVTVRADFLVAQGRARFVAEAKSGEQSARITGRATRRQLLEYWWVFEVDGILLVDVHAGSVARIEFSGPRVHQA